jgi:type II secretory ATPase GspE/PulE/Tfp pilus assembly ATPase PilB-like protein
MPTYDPNALLKAISELNIVDEKKLLEIFKYSQDTKTPFDEALIDKDIISDVNLGKLISDLLKIPFVRLEETNIPDAVLKIIPEIVAKKQKVITFAQDKTGISMAAASPENKEMASLISKKTGETVKIFYATKRDIERALGLYKKNIQQTFEDLIKEGVVEYGKKEDKETPIIKIVDTIVEYAYSNKASDIHIEPQDADTLVRFRIDGVLHDVLHFEKSIHEQIIMRIKVLSKLRTDEHLSAQDGKMQQKMEDEDLDIRVSIVPTVNGEKAVLRLLSSKSREFGLTDLGLSENDMEKVKKGFEKPYGMILSTGPTGSGKTTTIYSILKIINTRDRNIATIEDPVEYEIAGLNQIQVNDKTNLTFAKGLRSILRQDPDIIYVGEIRDEETAGIAINSATTGHLVLSTLHTNDAATTLPRLIDMGIEPFLVASTVNVIIGQRLVRKICEKCKVSTTITIEEFSKNIESEKAKSIFGNNKELRIYEGKGCAVCHQTGYNGRIGIFEVLNISESIKDLIVAKSDSDAIRDRAIKEGMTTMFDDGLAKVMQGITSFDEIMKATKLE